MEEAEASEGSGGSDNEPLGPARHKAHTHNKAHTHAKAHAKAEKAEEAKERGRRVEAKTGPTEVEAKGTFREHFRKAEAKTGPTEAEAKVTEANQLCRITRTLNNRPCAE
eukprot:916926-Prorocentrum_minimum.AAC.1